MHGIVLIFCSYSRDCSGDICVLNLPRSTVEVVERVSPRLCDDGHG